MIFLLKNRSSENQIDSELIQIDVDNDNNIESEFDNLLSDVKCIKEIAQDILKLVEEQNCIINSIDDNINNIDMNVKSSNNEIKTALRVNNNNSINTIGATTGAIIGSFFGPVGAMSGATIGFMATSIYNVFK